MTEREGHDRAAAHGGEVGLVEVVGILLRRWRVIAATAVGAGIATAALVVATVPRAWESAATLVVSPPALSSELSPKAFSLQTYQKLLESGSIIAEAQRRLEERGIIAQDQPLRRGRELETRIFVSRRSEETTLAPMVLAVARGRTPEQSAAIANTWADVFVTSIRELPVDASSPALQSVERQYVDAVAAMAALEATRLADATARTRAYDAAADRWDRSIAAARAGAAAAQAAYRAETARLLQEYESARGLQTRRAQLDALRQSLADLQGEQGGVEARRAHAERQLEAARAALAATPPLLEVRKAITDDALWQTTVSATPPAATSPGAGRSLVTQEVNPVHSELATTAARLEIEAGALGPRAGQLARLIETATDDLRVREIALAGDDAGLVALREDRQAGLAALLGSHATDAAVLARERERDLAVLGGERSNSLAAIDRETATLAGLLTSLSRLQSQAALARTQTNLAEVRLALPAVAPHAPEPRGTVAKGVVGAALGALAGVLLALALEARARATRVEGV